MQVAPSEQSESEEQLVAGALLARHEPETHISPVAQSPLIWQPGCAPDVQEGVPATMEIAATAQQDQTQDARPSRLKLILNSVLTSAPQRGGELLKKTCSDPAAPGVPQSQLSAHG